MRRPRIGLQEAHSIEDIQRFYMVMLPLSRPAPVRLVVVGKEHLPEHGQRFWAAVLAVGKTVCVPSSLPVHAALHTRAPSLLNRQVSSSSDQVTLLPAWSHCACCNPYSCAIPADG